jgi:hypothetical protein
MEDDSHVIFGQKFPGEEGSVRLCFVVMQQPVLSSPKFTQPLYVTVVCGIGCFACQDEFFVNNQSS